MSRQKYMTTFIRELGSLGDFPTAQKFRHAFCKRAPFSRSVIKTELTFEPYSLMKDLISISTENLKYNKYNTKKNLVVFTIMDFYSIIVKMIRRNMEKKLLKLSRQYPVVTVTGPRQSGKTTLCKMCFPTHFYCSLEDLDTRDHAQNDPRGFLEQSKKMIIDEIQKVPSLVSYIQGVSDKTNKSGQFILTGSHQFELTHIISQSLAGRVALVKLLPFSIGELGEKSHYSKQIYRGFYPRIIDKKLNPTQALSFYTNTYIQKDLRDIREIKNLRQFETFLRLCASHVGQVLNKARLANDIGIDSKTIDSWFSILQAGYIVFPLNPHFKNFRKRLVKRPKLYFYDVGLASYLLGIKKEDHVLSHPLKGALFENLVIAEKFKQKLNNVEDPSFYYFRDNTGNEVDLLEDLGTSKHSITPVLKVLIFTKNLIQKTKNPY